jgi:8-oxo-dGTP pyrophosphatase MutT (NUDIX family)
MVPHGAARFGTEPEPGGQPWAWVREGLDIGFEKDMGKLKPRTQYAAIPVRSTADRTEVMLVTSRETRRWVIPKGWPEAGLEPHQLAEKEAFEEAGLVGHAADEPYGTYWYDKTLGSGRTVPCRVEAFLMEVERELDDWPERSERERRWVTASQAAMLVEEGGLVDMLLRLAQPRAGSGPR